jgi:hypothetical protein
MYRKNLNIIQDEIVGIIDVTTWKIEKMYVLKSSANKTDLPIYKKGYPDKILFHSHPHFDRFCKTIDFPSLSDIFITLQLDYPYHIIFVKEGFFILEKTNKYLSQQELTLLLYKINKTIRNKICRFQSILMVSKFLNQLFKNRGLHFQAVI